MGEINVESNRTPDIDAARFRAQIERILRSKSFQQANRLARFLEFAAECALTGRETELKEYTIGVEAFDRGKDYNPRIDPIVRVQAGRLRSRLAEYYAAEGSADPVIVELVPGSYVPRFRLREITGDDRPLAQQESVAVLPFLNMSPDPDLEYFCDGITEEILHALARFPGLRVPARTSSFQFKGRSHDIREVSKQLQVRSVLEGSVRKQGQRLRITVQLNNGENGYHIWSEVFDRDVQDLLAVQEEIANSVAAKLRAGAQPAIAAPKVPKSVETYALCLLGRYHWGKQTPEGLQKGAQHFEQAIAAESDCAMAYAGLARCHLFAAFFCVSEPAPLLRKAKDCAMKAAELDPASSEAHLILGAVCALHDWKLEESEREYELAARIDPSSSAAYDWLNLAKLCRGDFDGARRCSLRALELDPLSPVIRENHAFGFFLDRRYPQSIEHYRTVLEIDAHYPWGYLGLGWNHLALNDIAEASRNLEFAHELTRGAWFVKGSLGLCRGLSGNREQARALFSEAESVDGYVPPYELALIHLGLDEIDQTFHYLDRAISHRNNWILFLKVNPLWDRLRSDARFQELLSRAGLA